MQDRFAVHYRRQCVGKVVSQTLWVLRIPYRVLRGWADKALRRPSSRSLPEQPVLEQALAGWLDHLHKEAVRRADTYDLLRHVLPVLRLYDQAGWRNSVVYA